MLNCVAFKKANDERVFCFVYFSEVEELGESVLFIFFRTAGVSEEICVRMCSCERVADEASATR